MEMEKREMVVRIETKTHTAVYFYKEDFLVNSSADTTKAKMRSDESKAQ